MRIVSCKICGAEIGARNLWEVEAAKTKRLVIAR
jgi:hypothetical protein